jgi:hypothetical protein
MSSSEDKLQLELMKTTVGAINAYCRVMELHVKAVEQGANPLTRGHLGDAVQMAAEGLKREVEFLTFLRSGMTGGANPTDYLGERS